MALIDRAGRFRGVPTQGIMGESTGGFPQFVVRFLATEYYDVDTASWVDWSPYQQSLTAYLILFNASKAMLNYEQVMKAFNWNGAVLDDLQKTDFGDLIVQFDVRENVYNGKTNLRIEWVDEANASPTAGTGGDLTPLDTAKLKQMTAKFGQFMKTAPKIAPVRGGNVPPVVSAPPSLPLPPPSAISSDPIVIPGVGITQQAAWANLNVANTGGMSPDDLATMFLKATDTVADGRDEESLTNVDWATVLSIASDAMNV